MFEEKIVMSYAAAKDYEKRGYAVETSFCTSNGTIKINGLYNSKDIGSLTNKALLPILPVYKCRR